tara:strand:+ start:243 stop:977 length:735 start_codon:yes stop_codon:yes gene_type:complete
MSLKSLIQVVILLIIIVILGGVYFNYFSNSNKIYTENNEKNIQKEVDENKPKKKEKKILNEKNNLKEEITKTEEIRSEEVNEETNNNANLPKKIKPKKPEIENTVKDLEYLTTDKNGNKYRVLATSGRTNLEDKNILDLDNVRGVITSDKNSTVYIVSDFAEYNSSSLKSNFYQNVVINYEDKQITCDYFDVDMQTNLAIAYNNVVVTDEKSIMKAGKIILNIETKVININPDNEKDKVKLTIN